MVEEEGDEEEKLVVWWWTVFMINAVHQHTTYSSSLGKMALMVPMRLWHVLYNDF